MSHAGEALKASQISQNAQGRWLSLLLTKGNAWNRLRFLKKRFTFLEELNRRIRENGTNLRLPCIYLFQVSPLPDQWSLPQNIAYFAFFLDFSHLFSDSDHFFRDLWVPLTFFPAATIIVYHILIKIREKINVLTQHSVNAHTKPLSEKQVCLSHAVGLIRRRLFLESVCSAIRQGQSLDRSIWDRANLRQCFVFSPEFFGRNRAGGFLKSRDLELSLKEIPLTFKGYVYRGWEMHCQNPLACI